MHEALTGCVEMMVLGGVRGPLDTGYGKEAMRSATWTSPLPSPLHPSLCISGWPLSWQGSPNVLLILQPAHQPCLKSPISSSSNRKPVPPATWPRALSTLISSKAFSRLFWLLIRLGRDGQ